ncbi:hypothetical protein BDQ17DRAFT_1480956 [Cyathus striatus]|nr:hypothetical protein BDQ17DRAFT_1480956 [Cyathus striatus]
MPSQTHSACDDIILGLGSADAITCVKHKHEPIDLMHPTHHFKVEDTNAVIDLCGSSPPPIMVQTQIIQEDGHNIVEIEDSDSEAEDELSDEEDPMNIDLPTHSIAPTTWLDHDVQTTSFEVGKIKLSKALEVDAVQYIEGIPTAWPIPHNAIIAYVLDLNDQKYNIRDGDGNPTPINTLIQQKDRDSFDGPNGKACLSCQGIWACEQVDPRLLKVTRYELDPNTNKPLVNAQIQANRDQGRSIISFLYTDLGTIKCTGTPVLKLLKQEDKRGKHYFISCSEWTRQDKDHHARSIPADIDEDILSILFANGSVDVTASDVHDTQACPTIISSAIALTTTLILEGETPAIHDAALMDKRRKKDMIWQAKLKESPGGLDLNGVYLQHLKDSRDLPVSQCYILNNLLEVRASKRNWDMTYCLQVINSWELYWTLVVEFETLLEIDRKVNASKLAVW